jgi:hypothetical protein
MIPEETVEGAAHAAKAVFRKDGHNLGCLERAPGLDRVGEMQGMQADHCARPSKGVLFNVDRKGAGPDKAEAIDIAAHL